MVWAWMLLGMFIGMMFTLTAMSIVAMSKEDQKPRVLLYDKEKITLEQCENLKLIGYDVVINDGEVKDIVERGE